MITLEEFEKIRPGDIIRHTPFKEERYDIVLKTTNGGTFQKVLFVNKPAPSAICYRPEIAEVLTPEKNPEYFL